MSDYHARHLGGGLIALYRGDEEAREIGITPGWHFKDRDEFIARYNRDAALQSEKARADAADSRIAALEAGMRGLVAKASEWNHRDRFSRENGGTRIYVSDCANELLDELSALLSRPADMESKL